MCKSSNCLSSNNTNTAISEQSIMVLDDDAVMRDLFNVNLERLGYKTVLARSGTEALLLYKQYLDRSAVIDAVILDLSLVGGMNGVEVAQNIRLLDPDAKIIVTSGNIWANEMRYFHQYGFCGALTKDFSRGALQKLLQQVLNSGD